MRIKSIDALRGVAILLVLGEHMYVSDLWMWVGWTGVDLFFVLSGFLISGLLFSEYKRHGEIRFSHFFIRRGLKIYPGYYMLLFYLVVRNLIQGREITRQDALQFVFLQNYGPGPVEYTWSLAVEEHFYLLLPLCLLLLHRRYVRERRRQGDAGAAGTAFGGEAFSGLPRVMAVVSCVLLLLRILTSLLLPYDIRTHHFPTHLRMDSLFFGVVIGYYYHFHPRWFRELLLRRRPHIAALSCSLLLFAVLLERTTFWMFTFGLSALYMGFGGLLVLSLSAAQPPETALDQKAPLSGLQRVTAALGSGLAFVGYYSYAIYLWHPPVSSGGIRLLRKVVSVDMPPTLEFVLYVIVSIAMGVAMTKLVEAPALKLRDRLWPSRGAVV